MSGITCTEVGCAKQVFYIETISNPLLEIPDIPAVAAFCQENRITSVIDNTFASPAVVRQATLKLPAALHTPCTDTAMTAEQDRVVRMHSAATGSSQSC